MQEGEEFDVTLKSIRAANAAGTSVLLVGRTFTIGEIGKRRI